MSQHPNDAFFKESLEFMALLYDKRGLSMFLDVYEHLERLLEDNLYGIGSRDVSLFFPRPDGFTHSQEQKRETCRSVCTMLMLSFCGDVLLSHDLIEEVAFCEDGLTILGDIPDFGRFSFKINDATDLEQKPSFCSLTPADQDFFKKYTSLYQAIFGETTFLKVEEHPEFFGQRHTKSKNQSYLNKFSVYYIHAEDLLRYMQQQAIKDELPQKPSFKRVM